MEYTHGENGLMVVIRYSQNIANSRIFLHQFMKTLLKIFRLPLVLPVVTIGTLVFFIAGFEPDAIADWIKGMMWPGWDIFV